MTDIVITTTLLGVPVNGLADVPEITIMRMDTFALVVTGAAMTDTGALGKYVFPFAAVRGLEYSASIDADPSSTGQSDTRFYNATFDRQLQDLYQVRGLDPAIPKSTTEVVAKTDYDEDAGDIHVDQVKAGAVITTTSS